MAVDLSDYVEQARASVSAPGEDFFPTSTDDQWVTSMANGFWEAFLAGFFKEYREADGIIVPRNPATTPDLPRESVQVIIKYTAYVALRNKLMSLKTLFRGKAGPTEVETQRSAQVLVEILKQIKAELAELKKDVLRSGRTFPAIWEATIARDEALVFGDIWWQG